MAKTLIYGNPISRASRPIWMAEELGLDYEIVSDGFAGRDHCDASFLAMNPNGTIPVLDDDGFILWESMAITLYLAKKHGGPLAPASLAEDGLMEQWSIWTMTTMEAAALDTVLHRAGLPPDRRDPTRVDAAADTLRRPFGVLEGFLDGREHLVGGRFTAADLNLCSVLDWARAAVELFAEHPRLTAYFDRARSRPAYRAMRALQKQTQMPAWVVERAGRA